MAVVFDCSDPDQREAGMTAAVTALSRGELVLLPTDTVYGVAADAFTPAAVNRLLAAKNRGRSMPVPVLIGEASTLAGLVVSVPPVAHTLAEAFWPGGLTLVVSTRPRWPGTWVRPRARSPSGCPTTRWPASCCGAPARWRSPAPTAPAGPPRRTRRRRSTSSATHVDVVLDGGPRAGSAASTIVDCTAPTPRVLRLGAIGLDRLREVVPDLTD